MAAPHPSRTSRTAPVLRSPDLEQLRVSRTPGLDLRRLAKRRRYGRKFASTISCPATISSSNAMPPGTSANVSLMAATISTSSALHSGDHVVGRMWSKGEGLDAARPAGLLMR